MPSAESESSVEEIPTFWQRDEDAIVAGTVHSGPSRNLLEKLK